VDDGVLVEITGNKKRRVYRADEIMKIIERDADTLPDPDDLMGSSPMGQLSV
jgi:hypothetical protein